MNDFLSPVILHDPANPRDYFDTLDDWLKEPERSPTFQKFMDSLPRDNRSFSRQLREEQRERYVGRKDAN